MLRKDKQKTKGMGSGTESAKHDICQTIYVLLTCCLHLLSPVFLFLYLLSSSTSLSQIDSSELIRSRERVARSLSTLRASLPPNTVYIYQPLQSQTTVQQDPTLPSCTLGMFKGEVREFYCICEKCCMKSFVAPERCDVRKK